MDKRRGKRKSPCADIIFEVSDNDMSSENADSDCEPETKISRTDFSLDISSNLTNVTQDSLLNVSEIVTVHSEVATCDNKKVTEESVARPTDCEESLEDGEVADIVTSKDEFDSKDKNSDDSCICISFSNTTMSDLYKFKFLKFLESFVELELVNETDLSMTVRRDTTLDPHEWIVLDETLCTSMMKEILDEKLASPLPSIPKKSSKKQKKKAKKQKELFVLDTNPCNDNRGDTNSLKYMSKFQIDVNEEGEDKEKEVRVATANKCFNCDGDHAFRDCSLPRNHGKINAARQKFRAQKQTSRYHLEQDQKYGHLLPGKISDNLRAALGLEKDEIPLHVYKMRIYNYPPGWLEEAKSVYSNLSMFGADGENVGQQHKKKQFLNPEKIVEYPGYNVPFEKHVKDQYRLYGVPPFSKEFHSKSAMIEYFEQQFASSQDDLTNCDMDIDLTIEGSGHYDQDVLKEATNGSVDTKSNVVREEDLETSSLKDLENVKETLQAALNDSNSVNTTLISEENASETQENTSTSLQIDISASENDTTSDLSPPSSQIVNSVMTSSYGTPILKSSSPYTHLPNSDNFTKDVSPVINFENLPNTTGKYEQMTEVLQKVRNTLKQFKS